MEKYLILYTIRGVQDYILESRKVMDLCNSSQLIINIVNNLANELNKKTSNFKIIQPEVNIEEKNYPNYFLATFELNSKNNDDINKFLKDNLDANLYKILEDYLKKNKNINLNKDQKEILQEQLKNVINDYWVIMPLDKTEDKIDYKHIEELYKYIENIKLQPSFSNLKEKGLKCTICGKRNILFLSESKESKESKIEKHIKDSEQKNQIINLSDLDEDEGLCAACLFKRIYEKNSSRNSTVSIATKAWRERKENFECINKIEELGIRKEDIPEIYDEKKYYLDYVKKVFSLYKKDKEKVKKLDDLKNRLKENEKKTKRKPSKYYVMLRLDIDSMSKWNEQLYGQIVGSKQKSFSSLASEFMTETKKVIDKYGRCIYAGGDDALGLISLDYLFDCVDYIENKFKDIFAEVENDKYQKPSFSISVVTAHYKYPLKDVLKHSLEDLENVKNEFSVRECLMKSGISLSYISYGGKVQTSYIRRKEYNSFKNIVEKINNLYSASFIEKFEKTFRFIDPGMEIDGDSFRKILSLELKRLIERSWVEEEKVAESKKKEIGEIMSIFKYFNNKYSDKDKTDIYPFIRFMNICRKINQEKYWRKGLN